MDIKNEKGRHLTFKFKINKKVAGLIVYIKY